MVSVLLPTENFFFSFLSTTLFKNYYVYLLISVMKVIENLFFGYISG